MKKILLLFVITCISPIISMEQSKEEALFNAIRKNDLTAVKKLIESGVKINIKDKDGTPPLMEAIVDSNIEIIRFLLQNGANVNFGKTTREGVYTPLEAAIFYDRPGITKLLIEWSKR